MRRYSLIKAENYRQISRSKKFLWVLLLALFLGALIYFLPRALSPAAALVISPVVAVQSWFVNSSAFIPTWFKDRSALHQVNLELEQRLAEQSTLENTVARLEAENNELLGFSTSTSTSRLVASVIGRPTTLPYDTLVIDKGTDSGVKENAPVYIGGDQVIGFVAATYPGTSVVVLATTPGFSSTVYVYGPNIYTTAVGVGGGTLEIQVPQGIDMKVGDVVVLPAFNSGVYGVISVIDSSPTRPEQYGYVSINTPLQGLRFVGVGAEPLRTLSFDEAKAVVERVRQDFLELPVPSGVLVDVPETSTTTATSTATSTEI